MDKGMKKRWISLYVENQVGVLSKISGLFSGKSYNLDSLTVGTTEDPTVPKKIRLNCFRLPKPSRQRSLTMAKTACSWNLSRQQPRMTQ